jgi:hypothetical protein
MGRESGRKRQPDDVNGFGTDHWKRGRSVRGMGSSLHWHNISGTIACKAYVCFHINIAYLFFRFGSSHAPAPISGATCSSAANP